MVRGELYQSWPERIWSIDLLQNLENFGKCVRIVKLGSDHLDKRNMERAVLSASDFLTQRYLRV